jgi:hypothetical protein
MPVTTDKVALFKILLINAAKRIFAAIQEHVVQTSGIKDKFRSVMEDPNSLGCLFNPAKAGDAQCADDTDEHCWSQGQREQAGVDGAATEVWCCLEKVLKREGSTDEGGEALSDKCKASHENQRSSYTGMCGDISGTTAAPKATAAPTSFLEIAEAKASAEQQAERMWSGARGGVRVLGGASRTRRRAHDDAPSGAGTCQSVQSFISGPLKIITSMSSELTSAGGALQPIFDELAGSALDQESGKIVELKEAMTDVLGDVSEIRAQLTAIRNMASNLMGADPNNPPAPVDNMMEAMSDAGATAMAGGGTRGFADLSKKAKTMLDPSQLVERIKLFAEKIQRVVYAFLCIMGARKIDCKGGESLADAARDAVTKRVDQAKKLVQDKVAEASTAMSNVGVKADETKAKAEAMKNAVVAKGQQAVAQAEQALTDAKSKAAKATGDAKIAAEKAVKDMQVKATKAKAALQAMVTKAMADAKAMVAAGVESTKAAVSAGSEAASKSLNDAKTAAKEAGEEGKKILGDAVDSTKLAVLSAADEAQAKTQAMANAVVEDGKNKVAQAEKFLEDKKKEAASAVGDAKVAAEQAVKDAQAKVTKSAADLQEKVAKAIADARAEFSAGVEGAKTAVAKGVDDARAEAATLMIKGKGAVLKKIEAAKQKIIAVFREKMALIYTIGDKIKAFFDPLSTLFGTSKEIVSTMGIIAYNVADLASSDKNEAYVLHFSTLARHFGTMRRSLGQFKLNIDSLDMTELEGQIKGARDSAVNEASGLVKSGVGGAMELKDDALAKVTDLTANTQDSAKALTAQAARTVNDKVSRRDGK